MTSRSTLAADLRFLDAERRSDSHCCPLPPARMLTRAGCPTKFETAALESFSVRTEKLAVMTFAGENVESLRSV
jgi:hypothetical protein